MHLLLGVSPRSAVWDRQDDEQSRESMPPVSVDLSTKLDLVFRPVELGRPYILV